jgi:hypothetical protein
MGERLTALSASGSGQQEANKLTPATSFPNVVLESPFMITQTPGLVLDSSNIKNWNSVAKFRI